MREQEYRAGGYNVSDIYRVQTWAHKIARQNLKKLHGYTLGTMPEPVIELLTRPGCHLCEDARLTVSEICAEYGLDYTELDITDNPDLLKRHKTEIPVLRIDGEAKDFWRINPKRMRKILDKKLAR